MQMIKKDNITDKSEGKIIFFFDEDDTDNPLFFRYDKFKTQDFTNVVFGRWNEPEVCIEKDQVMVSDTAYDDNTATITFTEHYTTFFSSVMFVSLLDGSWLLFENEPSYEKRRRGFRYSALENKLELVTIDPSIKESKVIVGAYSNDIVVPYQDVTSLLGDAINDPLFGEFKPGSYPNYDLNALIKQFENTDKDEIEDNDGNDVVVVKPKANRGLGMLYILKDKKYIMGDQKELETLGLNIFKHAKDTYWVYYGSPDDNNVHPALMIYNGSIPFYHVEHNGFAYTIAKEKDKGFDKTGRIFNLINNKTGVYLDFRFDEGIIVTKKNKDGSFTHLANIPFKKFDKSTVNVKKPEIKKDNNNVIPKATPKTKPSSGNSKLDALIGLEEVKEKVLYLEAAGKKNIKDLNLNFAFVGNPGTGKTEVARLFAEILYNNKILPTSNLVEVTRSDLVGEFIGASEKKTTVIIAKAKGGVLFIDEAYSLLVKGSSNDFGRAVVNTLMNAMTSKTDKICIIFAGYRDEMYSFFEMNPGLRSRIPDSNYIEFRNYNENEIREIIIKMINDNPSISNASEDAINEMTKLVMSNSYKRDFGNAREAKNIIQSALEKQVLRTKDDPNNHDITLDDVKAIRSIKAYRQTNAYKELDELIGLANVKTHIKELMSVVKKFKKLPDKLNLHMVFTGNPGTGKTEVAKLISQIYYEEGILPTNHCIEIDASGLVSSYTGQTQSKTHEVIRKSFGGVLFIDEAYSLVKNNFGKEAIDALLKDMEEYRGKFALILAGYPDEMNELFEVNSGFKSRIPEQNFIKFPNYSEDELIDIAKLMIKKDGYEIKKDALDEIRSIIQYKIDESDFENARFIRNILEGIETKQNIRTVDKEDDLKIILNDVEKYEQDHLPIDKQKSLEKYPCISLFDLLSLPLSYDVINYDYLKPRTVAIKVKKKKGAGEGTGFFISPTGYILTNAHVVNEAKNIEVLVNRKFNKDYIVDSLEAKLSFIDKDHDMALIKIEGNNYPFFTLLSEYDVYPEPLTEVIIGGYPLGKSRFNDISINQGRIQSYNKDSKLEDNDLERIYVDLKGECGNSGSALVDLISGRVIGIFSGASIDREANAVINYAIPIKYVYDLIRKEAE